MIRRVLTKTNGDYIGFIDDQDRRYTIDVSLQERLEELAGDTGRHLAVIDRESAFDGASALRATLALPAGMGARVHVDGMPSGLVLTRAELATLVFAMKSR